jgi:hypothetical protein
MFSRRVSAPDADGRIPDVAVLTRISNPVLQQMLEEVWQPFWAPSPTWSWKKSRAARQDSNSLDVAAQKRETADARVQE